MPSKTKLADKGNELDLKPQIGQLMQRASRIAEAKQAYEKSILLGDGSGSARKGLDLLNAEQH